MSLFRPQDSLQVSRTTNNVYWGSLLTVMDQFEQLIDREKKDTSKCLKDYMQKRKQLTLEFSLMKNYQKFENKVIKNQSQILKKQKNEIFFKGYHQIIEEIVKKVVLEPKVLANMLNNYKQNKKFKMKDFIYNLSFNVYPYYHPDSPNFTNHCMQFIQKIIELWSYNPLQDRHQNNTLIDNIIFNYINVPEVVCYFQEISSSFIEETNKCPMDVFAFDQNAIKNQIDLKKQASISQIIPKKRRRWQFWKDDTQIDINNPNLHHSEIQNTKKINDNMQMRQKYYIKLIQNVVKLIIRKQIPLMIRKIFQFFDRKIKKYFFKQVEIEKLLKHYCYFFITNLIFSQFVRKYSTINQQIGMKPACSQNLSEIIRILTSIFQFNKVQGKKYQFINDKLKNFNEEIANFYAKLLTENIETKSIMPLDQMRDHILHYYQSVTILSFNDIKILVNIVKNNSKIAEESGLSQQAIKLDFLKQSQIQKIFESDKKITFNDKTYETQNLYFMYQQCIRPSMKQIIDLYLNVEQPLKNITMLKDILLFSSNLTIAQALQISQNLDFMRHLKLHQIKPYLLKIQKQFKHLHIKNNKQIDTKFKQALKFTLHNSFQRKQLLLLYRKQMEDQMDEVSHLIKYYNIELRSAQFYEQICKTFITTTRIKLHLTIQDNIFCINSSKKQDQLKKLQISNILTTTSKQLNDDFIMRNSYKSFSNVQDMLKVICQNPIMIKAFTVGRKVEEFNTFFNKICDLLIADTQYFMSTKQIFESICKQKLTSVIVHQIQNKIYHSLIINIDLDDDVIFVNQVKKIDQQEFFSKDLNNIDVDWVVLEIIGKEKMQKMCKQEKVSRKIKHFQELFVSIFTIVGFNQAKHKITAELMNPITQFLILKCPTLNHHQNLFCLQCLKWKQSPQTTYQLALYQSSLAYICKFMAKDFPLKK